MSANAPRVTFEIVPTMDGFEVIATDTGRPVVMVDALHLAELSRKVLNKAAGEGPKALSRALAQL